MSRSIHATRPKDESVSAITGIYWHLLAPMSFAAEAVTLGTVADKATRQIRRQRNFQNGSEQADRNQLQSEDQSAMVKITQGFEDELPR